VSPEIVKTETSPVEEEHPRYDGDTAIKLYLREIGQVNLLTPQEKSNWPRALKRR